MPSHRWLEPTGGEAVCYNAGDGGHQPLNRQSLASHVVAATGRYTCPFSN
jgi:hypothetical protein